MPLEWLHTHCAGASPLCIQTSILLKQGHYMPLQDFVIAQKIGSGSYGVVHKVMRKIDGNYYAMKASCTALHSFLVCLL